MYKKIRRINLNNNKPTQNTIIINIHTNQSTILLQRPIPLSRIPSTPNQRCTKQTQSHTYNRKPMRIRCPRYLSPNRNYLNWSVIYLLTCLRVYSLHTNIRDMIHQCVLETYLTIRVWIGLDLVQWQWVCRRSLYSSKILCRTHCL